MLINSLKRLRISKMSLCAAPRRYFQSGNKEESHADLPSLDKCFYKTLGIEKNANQAEVKDAYLRLAKMYHPDVHPASLEYFTHLNKAYETLADEHKRAIYDEDQIGDDEYFSMKIGKYNIPLINLFIATSFVFLGSMGYYGYKKYMSVNSGCPLDNEHKSMIREHKK